MSKFSGKFVLRLPPDLHQILVKKSHQMEKSLNQVCLDLLSQKNFVDTHPAQASIWHHVYEHTFEPLKKNFGKKLLGIVGFGSYAKGQQTESSDIDLLIILDASIPLTRSLYRWWDTHVHWISSTELNAHFIHLPRHIQNATGIWFEVAQNHHMLYQQKSKVAPFFKKAIGAIQKGQLRQYWSHGHPYWVWR